MDNNIYDCLKNIIEKEKIDFKNINFELIKKNIETLKNIFIKLKNEYNILINNKKKITYKKIFTLDKDYNQIFKLIMSSIFSENKIIINEVKKLKYIGQLSYLNIDFYWIYTDNENELYKKALKMFIISLCLNKFKYANDEIKRIIIWIPINKKRDFFDNKINKETLFNSYKNFEAFTVSGVTWGSNPKYTIITRYEEVEKLLIHELIHNYNIDGSSYHREFKIIINKYNNYKNNKNSKKSNYNYEYSIYESYTELLSTYFYLLFANIELSNREIKDKLLGQIVIELIYSYNIIANLIKLNNYNNYDDFLKDKKFIGNICFYEYYYIKGIMYNNYLLKFGNNINEFKKIYLSIIKMIENNNTNDDLLMRNIYLNYIKLTNFRYQIN